MHALTEIEEGLRLKGFTRLAGVDEAGRGPLAGPVVAAACMIAPGLYFSGINDSKLLTAKKREGLHALLLKHPDVNIGIGIVDHETIDRINILQATFLAMQQAVTALDADPDCLLIDGPHTFSKTIYSEPIIKGDQLSQMIAAASIIAKQTRDALMMEYHLQYPEYGFNAHKGYGTKGHLTALAKYGPSPIHRLTFRWHVE